MVDFEQNKDVEQKDPINKIEEKPEISMKLKIFDYIFAGIAALGGILGLVNGMNRGAWGWLPFGIAIGLIMHKKFWRIVCIVLMSIEIIAIIFLLNL